MSPLIIYNGSLLIRNGALALSTNCCCEENCVTCLSPSSISWSNANTDRFPPCELTISKGAYKTCFLTSGNIFDTDCGETAIDWNTSWDQDTAVITGCNNLCYANPLLVIEQDYHLITVDDYTAGEITSIGLPSFTVSLDFDTMFSEYPNEECWNFYWTSNYGVAEKIEFDCDYSQSAYESRSYRSSIKIYAVKVCCCSDGGEASVVDITADYINGVTVNTAGAIELDTTDYWFIGNEDTEGLAIVPPIFNAPLTVECLDECP